MNDEATERLARLEAHLAHLERNYDQLNEVVIALGKTVEKLLARQHSVVRSLEDIEAERIRATNPKPPHYQ